MNGTSNAFFLHAPTAVVMSSPSAEEVIDAFIHVVRDQLEKGDSIEVPTLGTFKVEHRPSEMKEEGGERQMVPPRNVVTFEPEQN